MQICSGLEVLSKSPLEDAMNDVNERGFCIAPLSSIINNSCIPNVRRCFTNDMKIMFYAMEPILRGPQV